MKSQISKPFDPNFEALLHEAAADPHSILLRVRRPQIFPALRRREPAVSVAMAGLSSVERELLASYRCELGFLLRQAAFVVLMNDATARTWIDLTIADRRIHDLPSEEEWAQRAGQCVGWVPLNASRDLLEILDIVQQLVTEGLTTASVPEIAAAALRIESVDQPRVYTGAHLAAIGDSSRSIDVLRCVLDGLASRENEAFAREATALALGRAGQLIEAANMVRDALQLRFERAELPLRYLFYAALSGDLESTLEAARIVSETVPLDHPGIGSFCTDVAGKVRCGYWAVSPSTRLMLENSNLQPNSISQRVLNELSATI